MEIVGKSSMGGKNRRGDIDVNLSTKHIAKTMPITTFLLVTAFLIEKKRKLDHFL